MYVIENRGAMIEVNPDEVENLIANHTQSELADWMNDNNREVISAKHYNTLAEAKEALPEFGVSAVKAYRVGKKMFLIFVYALLAECVMDGTEVIDIDEMTFVCPNADDIRNAVKEDN